LTGAEQLLSARVGLTLSDYDRLDALTLEDLRMVYEIEMRTKADPDWMSSQPGNFKPSPSMFSQPAR